MKPMVWGYTDLATCSVNRWFPTVLVGKNVANFHLKSWSKVECRHHAMMFLFNSGFSCCLVSLVVSISSAKFGIFRLGESGFKTWQKTALSIWEFEYNGVNWSHLVCVLMATMKVIESFLRTLFGVRILGNGSDSTVKPLLFCPQAVKGSYYHLISLSVFMNMCDLLNQPSLASMRDYSQVRVVLTLGSVRGLSSSCDLGPPYDCFMNHHLGFGHPSCHENIETSSNSGSFQLIQRFYFAGQAQGLHPSHPMNGRGLSGSGNGTEGLLFFVAGWIFNNQQELSTAWLLQCHAKSEMMWNVQDCSSGYGSMLNICLIQRIPPDIWKTDIQSPDFRPSSEKLRPTRRRRAAGGMNMQTAGCDFFFRNTVVASWLFHQIIPNHHNTLNIIDLIWYSMYVSTG